MLDSTFFLTVALLLFAGLRSVWTSRLLLLLLLSPVLRYGLALFGFTIRLRLSEWAGALLRLGGTEVQVEGNVLVRQLPGVGPVEMAVDPACMGLHLTGLSVLVAVFWLMWHERQAQRQVPLRWVLVYGGLTFGFTIFCNLIRIVLLVAFNLGPDTVLHEGVGLICVVFYAWLPAWLLARWVVKQTGQAVPTFKPRWQVVWGSSGLAVGVGLMAFTAQPPNISQVSNRQQVAAYERQGFTVRKVTKDGFFQLTKPGWLVYVKPLPDWWSAEHSPVVCWRGGGYELRRVREQIVGGKALYTAQLRHQNRPTLYTAWWFANGEHHTIEQLDFRWRMALGEPRFALINVTAEKPFTTHQIKGLIR